MAKDGITLTKSPSYHQDEQMQPNRLTLLINIYAPSGTAKRHEREYFFNNELPYLLKSPTARMIIGGDFNCVITTSDTTGNYIIVVRLRN